MTNQDPFRKLKRKEIEQRLSSLTDVELKEAAADAKTNAEHYLIAAEILLKKKLFKGSQVLSSIALEETVKGMALLDLKDRIKTPSEVVKFFRSHEVKFREVYKQKKYSKQRVMLNQQARYLSFKETNKMPTIYANEGFESLARHEIEDVNSGLQELDKRLQA